MTAVAARIDIPPAEFAARRAKAIEGAGAQGGPGGEVRTGPAESSEVQP